MWQTGIVWVGLTISMIVAAEGGFWARAALRESDAPDANVWALLMTPILSLMCLLAAFTFGMADSRYEHRRQEIVVEANAISTVHLRQQLLGLPDRLRLDPLMREYAATRLADITNVGGPRTVADLDHRTGALQERIWNATARALQTPEGVKAEGLLLPATNEMFNVAEDRRQQLEARIPGRAIRVLFMLSLAACFLIGMTLAAHGSRRRIVSGVVVSLFALAMTLIRDLDDPGSTGMPMPHGAMDRVVQRIASDTRAGEGSEAAHPEAPPPGEPSHSP
jgi:hypothetical protein